MDEAVIERARDAVLEQEGVGVRMSRGGGSGMKAPPKRLPAEESQLVAAIETFETAYHVLAGETRADGYQEEAIITIAARIQSIGRTHRHLVGKPLKLTLACNRFTGPRANSPLQEWTSLLSLQFSKAGCSTFAYLPAEPFWAMRSMLSAEAIERIGVSYTRWPHQRSARVDILSLEPRGENVDG